jgi:isocitrate dehydrogenase
MDAGDFRHNETSVTVAGDDTLRIEHVDADGNVTVLKEEIPVLAGEVVDATYMSRTALVDFLRAQVADAAERDVLFSLHMKATMMKVSDPIIFGHAVEAYFADVFEQYGDELTAAGADPTSGLGDVLGAIDDLGDPELQGAVRAAIARAREEGPDLAMVNSHKDITGLHVPSDFIIDASMPAMIRNGGKMWDEDDQERDAKAVIPDSSYADLYQATIDNCIEHGAFDPTTMGTVPNVGLMAKKAEEYGSHDKTFEIDTPGTVRVVAGDGQVLLSHEVEAGDIWRACQAKDDAIRDWVGLAVRRARETGWPAVFWLDAERAHDAQLIAKVERYLEDHDTAGLDLRIMNVRDASDFSLERARAGENTISVTGNVLRDYLTDLFPILEVGTSAKMLSIVPLMNGGGLFETGAGGSAPKHVQQVQAENHLRWDSLGEFLALAVSLDHLAATFDNAGARVLGAALDAATERLLEEGRSPQRKVDTPDNRSSHAWLALFWAEALAAQDDDPDLAALFAPFAARLRERIDDIEQELLDVQGEPVDLGGYYNAPKERLDEVMRPSRTFNEVLAGFDV